MVFTLLFIVSFVLIVFLFSLKAFEMKTGKVFISKETLNKSDGGIKYIFGRIFDYYNRASDVVAEIPGVYDDFKVVSKIRYRKTRDKIAFKVIHALNINNIRDIDKNKGSVSLFLRSISEDKEAKKKL